MSQKEGGSRTVFLADTDLFFFYLRGGKLSMQARQIIKSASSNLLELMASSEVYDDAISALRSGNVPLDIVRVFISSMRSIPHKALPSSAEIAEEAIALLQNML